MKLFKKMLQGIMIMFLGAMVIVGVGITEKELVPVASLLVLYGGCYTLVVIISYFVYLSMIQEYYDMTGKEIVKKLQECNFYRQRAFLMFADANILSRILYGLTVVPVDKNLETRIYKAMSLAMVR